jgi:hypothetical protein
VIIKLTDKEARAILEAIEWELQENTQPPRGYFAALKRAKAKLEEQTNA